MKEFFLLFFTLLFFGGFVGEVWGQPWTYNFGTSTGVHSSETSTTFLPSPETNGGTDRVRVGTGGGSWNMENQIITFGSGSYLRGVAPTAGVLNKFSIYDYSAGKSFTLRL